jgi:hypothetical protein
MSVIKSSIPFIGIATLGWILFLLGQIAFLVNVQKAFIRFCMPWCAAVCQGCCPGVPAAAPAPAKPKGGS